MSDMVIDVLDALEALIERALTTSAEAGAFDLAAELRIDPTAMRRLEDRRGRDVPRCRLVGPALPS